MSLSQAIAEALQFIPVTSFTIYGTKIAINETLLVSWIVMAILIIASILLTRRLRTIPRGPQAILEVAVEFLDNFSREQFGRRAKIYGPYIGTLFLFILFANIIPAITPVAITIGGHRLEPLFVIKPPTRDVNLTAALAIFTILLVIFGGLKARGIKGWLKNLLHPVPMMLPFNILEFFIRPTSLCLRLFGNMLGGFIILRLIETVVPLILPPVISLWFDFLDGIIQALVFSFLATLYFAEAVKVE
ncbi:MAG: F0F1 ATP synthase subunit A [Treponema sp.]|nr:F0F1 ATP synthase subunit A [Treponema sp.]